jgi:hypothetical protein
LNEQICEEPSFPNEEDLSWETIKIFLFTLTLENEKIHFDGGDEFSENNHLLGLCLFSGNWFSGNHFPNFHMFVCH